MERNILGDRKKPRYDDTLVDKVNKQVAEEVARQKEQTSSDQTEQNIPDEETIIEKAIDTNSSKLEIINSMRKNQGDWFTFARQEGKDLVSMEYLYASLKKTNQSFSQRIRNCLEQSPLMTGTTIMYDRAGLLLGKIKNYQYTEPTGPGAILYSLSSPLTIPEVRYTPIEELIKTPEGLIFIQELLRTKDAPNSIQLVLSGLINEGEDIYVLTRSIDRRIAWGDGGVYICRNYKQENKGITIACTGMDVWEDKDIDTGFAILIKK